jgi:hypothetical protein
MTCACTSASVHNNLHSCRHPPTALASGSALDSCLLALPPLLTAAGHAPTCAPCPCRCSRLCPLPMLSCMCLSNTGRGALAGVEELSDKAGSDWVH